MAPRILFVLAYLLFAFLTLAVMFLLMGLGLWRMGRNAGTPYAWTAFFPLGNGYVLGALADRSRHFYTGRVCRLGLAFWLPVTQALAVVSMMGVFGLALMRSPFNFLVAIFIGAFFLGAMVSVGLNYFCVYHTFKDYAPENAVLYTVIGIVFGIYWIFFLVEMNTVPASVAGPGPFPYGRPKYGRQQWQQWPPQPPWPQGAVPGQPPYQPQVGPGQPVYRQQEQPQNSQNPDQGSRQGPEL